MRPKVVAIISARMTSTRRPGKVMAPIMGKPMLELLLERVKRAQLIDQIVIATTTNETDDCVANLTKKLGVACFRGSEHDVLGRVLLAARKYKGDVIVRLTGDNPLIDPLYIDKGIKIFLSGKYDYVANDNVQLTMPRGFDVEIFSTKSLAEVNQITNDKDIHEHVTLYFWKHPEKYKLKSFGPDKRNDKAAKLHLAVDTEEDLTLIRKIFKALSVKNPNFSYEDVIDLLNSDFNASL